MKDIRGGRIILPEAHLNYRAEMFLGDLLSIDVRAELHQKSSFAMVYRIERDGDVTVRGQQAWSRLIMTGVGLSVCRRNFGLLLNYLKMNRLVMKRGC